MKIETHVITFLLVGPCVWLARKKKKIGKGLYNGYGGKVELNEDPRQAAVREIEQESTVSVSPEKLIVPIVIDFRTDHSLVTCHMFLATHWHGKPMESDEMTAPQLFKRSSLPLSHMMRGDALWLPRYMQGKDIPLLPNGMHPLIIYNEDRTVVLSHNIPKEDLEFTR